MRTTPKFKALSASVISNIRFADVFNLDDIQQLQDSFSEIAGVVSVITDPDGMLITKSSNFCRLCDQIIPKTEIDHLKCFKSDISLKKTNLSDSFIEPCKFAGTLKVSATISIGDKHIASWHIGKLRNTEIDEPGLLKLADDAGVNKTVWIEALKKVAVMPNEQFDKVAHMLSVLTNELSEKGYYNLQLKAQIAEHEKVTTLLNDSEVRNSFLFDGNHSIILLIEAETGKIKDANAAACKFYQWSHAALCKMNISDINILPEEEVKHEKQRAIDEQCNHFIFKHCLANGEIRDVEVHSWSIKSSKPAMLYSIIYDITERLKVEDQLRISENKYKNLIENINEVIFEVDENGIVKFISSPIVKILGYKAEEIIGTSFKNFVGGNAELLLQRLRSLSENLETENEYMVLSKTGEPYWIRLSTKAIFKNGSFKGGTGTLTNITEKKQTQLALQKSESLYRSILNASPDSIVIADLEGRILFSSPRTLKMFNYNNTEDLVGHKVLEFVDEKDHARVRDNISLMLQGTFNGSKNYTGIKADRTAFDVEVNLAFIRDAEEKPVNMVFVCRDISERKEAEEKIKKSEETYRNLVESINDVIYEINYEGTIKYISPAIERVIGYKPEELVGKNIFNFFYEEDKPALMKRLATLDKKDYNYLEYRCINKSGYVCWIRSSTMAIIENGKIVGGTGSFIDVTLSKNAEIEIKNKTAILTNLIINLKEGVLLEDSNRKIILTNQLFCDMFGIQVPPEALIGSDCSQSAEQSKMYFKNADKFIADINLILSAKKAIFNDELELLDGRVFERDYIPTYLENIYNGHLWKYRDITERKLRENEIRDLNINLELKIKERTSQLAEKNINLQKEIDERKRVEEALSKSEHSYRSVVENVKEIIFSTDADGLWLFLNKSWEEVTGFSVDESVGQLFLNYVHPDDRQRNMELFEPLISRKKDHCRHRVRYLTKEGGFRWVEVFARLGVDENDKITGTYGTLVDITERKRAEDFENELLQLSPKLTGIPLSEIDSALNMALGRIGQFLAVDRSYIFEFSQDKMTMHNSHEWCNDGIQPELVRLQNIPCTDLPMVVEKLRQHENVILPSIDDLPEKWKAERTIFKKHGVKSLIIIPVLVENNLIGFVGLDSIKEKKEIIPVEINILKVWSSMIASLINNQRTESLLEQARQNFETFFNTIDDFLWVLDEKGNIIHTNNTVINRLDYSKEELTNEPVMMVHPTERREEAGRIVGEMLAGTAEYCPVPIVTKAGKQIPVETRVKKGFWNGQPVIFGVSKDVSKIKLSEEKFSKAFHSNTTLMAISGFEDGKYIDVNETFLSTLGYTRDEIIGKTSFEFNLYADRNTRITIIETLKQNQRISEVEIIIQSKSGKLLVSLFSADFIYIGDQRCLLTMMVDITLRKQAEEEIRKARQEADEANTAKSEFLSRMSHELRTPLNSILGFAQLLEMGELLPGQENGLNYIRQSGKHLLDLINEVLDISKIEAGHISLSMEPVKIITVIQEMVEIVQPLANERNLTIELLSSPSNQLFIQSDRQRLKQVLLNLLNNAIKYNRVNGSIQIKTEVMGENEAGIVPLRISVIDTGMGISAEDIPKLFRPFERIGAEKTETEGTGLGLAVVKKLMDAMGGHIEVESTLGIGSTFRIEFPVSENLLAGIEKNIKSNKSDVLSTNKNGTILYIEDNISNVELVKLILSHQRSGIHLITETNGRQAVPQAIKAAPDLILLDLDLPDIHGSEVIKLLQANEKTCNIPVVIISADAMPKQLQKLFEAGAKHYLTKPLDVTSFLKVIDEFVIS